MPVQPVISNQNCKRIWLLGAGECQERKSARKEMGGPRKGHVGTGELKKKRKQDPSWEPGPKENKTTGRTLRKTMGARNLARKGVGGGGPFNMNKAVEKSLGTE